MRLKATAAPGLAEERQNRANHSMNAWSFVMLGAKRATSSLCTVPHVCSNCASRASRSSDRGRPGIVWCPGVPNIRTIEHQRECALWIRCRELNTEWSAFRHPHQDRSFHARGIHDRTQVIHPIFQRWDIRDPIGQSSSPFVEGDDARESGQSSPILSVHWIVPNQIDVRDETLGHNKVERPLPKHLIGDVDIAAPRVLGAWWSGSVQPAAQSRVLPSTRPARR